MGKRIGTIFWVLSFAVTVIGFFLQTILIPIQDFDTISKEELKQIQMDLAINYSLGHAMLYAGLTVFLCSSMYLVILFIRNFPTNKVR